nr:unnamed protein product [Digitaria exilis]
MCEATRAGIEGGRVIDAALHLAALALAAPLSCHARSSPATDRILAIVGRRSGRASDDTQMATHPGKKHALGTAGMLTRSRIAARAQGTQLATKPKVVCDVSPAGRPEHRSIVVGYCMIQIVDFMALRQLVVIGVKLKVMAPIRTLRWCPVAYTTRVSWGDERRETEDSSHHHAGSHDLDDGALFMALSSRHRPATPVYLFHAGIRDAHSPPGRARTDLTATDHPIDERGSSRAPCRARRRALAAAAAALPLSAHHAALSLSPYLSVKPGRPPECMHGLHDAVVASPVHSINRAELHAVTMCPACRDEPSIEFDLDADGLLDISLRCMHEPPASK